MPILGTALSSPQHAAATASSPESDPSRSRRTRRRDSPDSTRSNPCDEHSKSSWWALLLRLVKHVLDSRQSQWRHNKAKQQKYRMEPETSSRRSPLAKLQHSPQSHLERRGSKVLHTILADPEVLDMFEKHLEHEFGIESMFFLEDTAQWIYTYHDVAPAVRLARARKIYKTYVDHNSPFAINVPSHLSLALQSALLGADVDPIMFDQARNEVARLLERGAVARFVATSAFKESRTARASSSTSSSSLTIALERADIVGAEHSD